MTVGRGHQILSLKETKILDNITKTAISGPWKSTKVIRQRDLLIKKILTLDKNLQHICLGLIPSTSHRPLRSVSSVVLTGGTASLPERDDQQLHCQKEMTGFGAKCENLVLSEWEVAISAVSKQGRSFITTVWGDHPIWVKHWTKGWARNLTGKYKKWDTHGGTW